MTMYVPDNYDLYRQHEARQEAEFERLPECSECGEKITDDQCWLFDSYPICDRCAVQNYRKYTSDLME